MQRVKEERFSLSMSSLPVPSSSQRPHPGPLRAFLEKTVGCDSSFGKCQDRKVPPLTHVQRGCPQSAHPVIGCPENMPGLCLEVSPTWPFSTSPWFRSVSRGLELGILLSLGHNSEVGGSKLGSPLCSAIGMPRGPGQILSPSLMGHQACALPPEQAHDEE